MWFTIPPHVEHLHRKKKSVKTTSYVHDAYEEKEKNWICTYQTWKNGFYHCVRIFVAIMHQIWPIKNFCSLCTNEFNKNLSIISLHWNWSRKSKDFLKKEKKWSTAYYLPNFNYFNACVCAHYFVTLHYIMHNKSHFDGNSKKIEITNEYLETRRKISFIFFYFSRNKIVFGFINVHSIFSSQNEYAPHYKVASVRCQFFSLSFSILITFTLTSACVPHTVPHTFKLDAVVFLGVRKTFSWFMTFIHCLIRSCVSMIGVSTLQSKLNQVK